MAQASSYIGNWGSKFMELFIEKKIQLDAIDDSGRTRFLPLNGI